MNAVGISGVKLHDEGCTTHRVLVIVRRFIAVVDAPGETSIAPERFNEGASFPSLALSIESYVKSIPADIDSPAVCLSIPHRTHACPRVKPPGVRQSEARGARERNMVSQSSTVELPTLTRMRPYIEINLVTYSH